MKTNLIETFLLERTARDIVDFGEMSEKTRHGRLINR